MPERSRDWLKQAEYDLEKANLDGEARGHGVRELFISLKLSANDLVKGHATYLDRFYIPTRYPNGLPAGVPHEYFSESDADKVIEKAEPIITDLRDRAEKLLQVNQEIVEVSLFGSLVSRNYCPGSDADVLVIVRSDSRLFVDRLDDFLVHFSGLGMPVDVFPYTMGEIEALKDSGLVKSALSERVTLYPITP